MKLSCQARKLRIREARQAGAERRKIARAAALACVAEFGGNPAPGRGGEVAPRLQSCTHVMDCLTLGELKRWDSMSCARCPIYWRHPDADEKWWAAQLYHLAASRH